MKKLILLAVLAPAIASAQIQASASFTLDLPIIIPPLVVIQPGIQVVPDVDFEVFHADGFYWTQREGRWYRSSNPRSGWAYHPHGYPPGLAKLKPGHYKRWKGAPPPARPAFRAPVYRGDDRHDGRRGDHGGDHDGRGGGKKHGKHD
jgi:hypothetical protein